MSVAIDPVCEGKSFCLKRNLSRRFSEAPRRSRGFEGTSMGKGSREKWRDRIAELSRRARKPSKEQRSKDHAPGPSREGVNRALGGCTSRRCRNICDEGTLLKKTTTGTLWRLIRSPGSPAAGFSEANWAGSPVHGHGSFRREMDFQSWHSAGFTTWSPLEWSMATLPPVKFPRHDSAGLLAALNTS